MSDRKLDAMLQSFPELAAPSGFSKKLYARLNEEAKPEPVQYNPFKIPGILCIASAVVMVIVINTPVINFVPEILQKLGGLIQWLKI